MEILVCDVMQSGGNGCTSVLLKTQINTDYLAD